MAIKLESFLVLEESLTDRLLASWVRKSAGIINKIIAAAKRGDFERAYELVDDISMEGVIKANDNYIRLVGMSAMMFGVSRLTSNPKKSETAKQGEPDALDKSSELMEMALAENGTESLRKTARRLIDAEQRAQLKLQDDAVRKAATANFVTGFKSSLTSAGAATINIASSLHTSRLAQWGFTTEAELTGVQYYKVNEQLDGRTCPVCREMHGKIFPVAPAKAKLERWLGVDDPADLKSIAPFPKQDPASVANLARMSTSELIQAGLDTPPYHPRCRGVLVKSSTASDVEVTVPPVAPEFDLTDLRSIVEDEGLVTAAQLVSENLEGTLSASQLAVLLGLRGETELPESFDADEVG